jgi:hypothetical protein
MKLTKSFSLKFRRSLAKPNAEASQSASRGSAQDLFRPAATRYRRRLQTLVITGIVGFGLVFLVLFLPDVLLLWVGIPGVICIIAALLLFYCAPGLTCPSCGKLSDSGFDQFCPECGKAQLRISFLWGTHCDACGRQMGSNSSMKKRPGVLLLSMLEVQLENFIMSRFASLQRHPFL